MNLQVQIAGRTDDDRDALLLLNGQVFRWPDPSRALDDHGPAKMTIGPGRTYQTRGAGSFAVLQSPDHELILRFPFHLPTLPPRCDVAVVLEPDEVNEGVEEPLAPNGVIPQ